MTPFHIEHKPSPAKLEVLAVDTWPIWTKEISTFPWHYDQTETCYILQGEARITVADTTVLIQRGDLVTFPAGLSCTWQVTQPLRKHYRFA